VQDRITKCLGLVAQYSALSVAPGALLKADDCLNRRENIVEDRRGHKAYSSLASPALALLTYQNRVLNLNGTTLQYDDGSGSPASYSGSYSAPAGARMRGVEAFSNLFVTTSLGVKIFSDITGTAGRLAGVPRALDPSYTLTGGSGFLDDGYQCAYRSVIVRTDAPGNVITGYPSQRLWVVNGAGGSRNVVLTEYLPSEAAAGDVIQFYRTAKVSGTSDDDAGEEMGLVYQYELVAADITAGYITFTDSIVDELRGATLYTSPSQEGIAQANDRPPLAKDICLYKTNFMLYANTQTKQRLFVTLVGAGSLSGKTITLGGVTYNFGASEIISGGGSPQVKVSSTGVAAFDIDETARSLVRVINRYALNTSVYAYYMSGSGDLPGQIMIEEKGVGASAFTLQASDSAISGMFFPAPPVSPATNSKSTSSNQVQKNAVYYSKSQQPEHCPTLNFLPVGSANKEILRIFALRESAIVIKEEGVYRITGETPQSFTVVPVDTTVYCRAPNSAVVLANQVFMLSNQGVVAISESGVQVVSHDIEALLTPILTNPSLADHTSAIAYESERMYFLSLPSLATPGTPVQTFIYNYQLRTWVRHKYAFTVGIVETNADKMYFAKPSDTTLYVERKAFDDTDYADPEYSVTITSIDDDEIEFTFGANVPQVGWVLSQGGSDLVILKVTPLTVGWRAVVDAVIPGTWVTGAATLYPGTGMDIEWQPWTGGAPDVLKQVSMAAVLADDTLGDNSASLLTMTFRTNFDPEREDVDLDQPEAGWGAAWGSTPWGGSSDPAGYPTYVPQNKQYCTRLIMGVKHTEARRKLVIAGCAFVFNSASERIGR
jgi:hypothetical protein